MKKFIISLLSLFASITVIAQSDLLNNPENRAYFGARISLDITSAAGGNDEYSNGAGFSFGAIYNIPLYMNLYFEPGLSIFYNTIDEDIPEGANGEMIDGSVRNFGFRVPLSVGYHFDFTDDMQFSVFTGPQINMSLKATEHFGEDSYSIFGDHGFNHIDLQWAIGVGLSRGRYYASISGGIGMTKARDFNLFGYKDSFRRNNLSIVLGYNF